GDADGSRPVPRSSAHGPPCRVPPRPTVPRPPQPPAMSPRSVTARCPVPAAPVRHRSVTPPWRRHRLVRGSRSSPLEALPVQPRPLHPRLLLGGFGDEPRHPSGSALIVDRDEHHVRGMRVPPGLATGG